MPSMALMRTTLLLCLALSMANARGAPERIAPDNAHRLAVAWTYDTRDPIESLAPGGDAPLFEATPVHVAGRLYLSTPLGTVAALDAETGAEIWRVNLGVARDVDYSDFANRGPAVRAIVCTSARSMLASSASTAAMDSAARDFGRDGQVDLSTGLRRPPQSPAEYGVTSPPAVFRDLVIVGSSVADNSRARMASGEVRAFDATTGALRWTFHPLPAQAAAGGANAWSRIVVDEENALVFVPTGSASPDYFGGLRVGNDGYANSIVALNALTGEVVWHFQAVHHDLWDYDVASPALLYPGESGPAVASARRSAMCSCSIASPAGRSFRSSSALSPPAM